MGRKNSLICGPSVKSVQSVAMPPFLRNSKEVHVERRTTLVTCLAVFLVCSALYSQGSSARILGSITDQSGAVIPGVTVTVRDIDRGAARTLTTDEAGAYS